MYFDTRYEESLSLLSDIGASQTPKRAWVSPAVRKENTRKQGRK